MATDNFYQLCFHVIWSTYRRQPVLEDPDERQRMVKAIETAAHRFGARVLACNTMPDHAHLLVSLAPGDLPQFVGRVKGGSMYAFNQPRPPDARLRWQDGYGIVSLRLSDADAVVDYVRNQETIHAERRAIDNLETDMNPP